MKRSLQFIQDFLCNYFSRKRPRLTNENEYTSNQMTSSSSSSHAPRIKYDVFISFRGIDIRRSFLSHLVDALKRKQIEAFVDDRLQEGDELLHALFTAIEESKIALVIFSEDYASSKWCLKELVKINDCRKRNGQIVVPIFYNVVPSHVRHQTGYFEKVFARHEQLFREDTKKWRTTMEEVANLSGLHCTKSRTEAELIKDVVQRLLTRLKNMYQVVNFKGLFGIDEPIADLQSLMSCIESERVGVIGIWGMGGLGKTTIAQVLFNTLRSEFEGCYFQANVREELEKYGKTRVKSKLISILLEKNDPNIDIPTGVPDHVLRRLQRKKALVVLDDVNDPNQIESLIGGHDWLGRGSRIIVTTRDKHVIEKEADYIYEVEALGSHDALQLLKFHAFDEKRPQMSLHDELMMKVVEYAKGIPLALEVLGSFLYGKNAQEWESQLQKLQKIPFPKIQNVLRLSYEGLDDEEQCIFLYLACFFEETKTKADIQVLLDACGYSTSIALRTLQDRALIKDDTACVYMHDLIREMGREIVREQSRKMPGERTHLWDPTDIYRVLKDDEGTDSIESITLDLTRIKDLNLSPHSFARMVNLKLLRIYEYKYSDVHAKVHLPEGLRMLSDKIKLFHWDEYPLTSLPATFNPENLVQLRMRRSHVTKLWDVAPNLPNLKEIDLSYSKQLVEFPDLSKASSLECLMLSDCDNLVSVHSYIWSLPNVESVDLSYCRRLEELPAIEALPSSVTFHTKLRDLLLTSCLSLKHLPDSISKLTSLKELWLCGCKELDTSNLQIIFDGLHSLTQLYMDECCKLYELPENISKLSSLRILSLSGTNVKSLPERIKHLPQLSVLFISDCGMLQSISEPPLSLQSLDAANCPSLEKVPVPTSQQLEQYIPSFDCFSFRYCPKLDILRCT